MNQDMIAAAAECLDTPFRHQGRLAGIGLDCAGVLAHCLDRLGLPYTDQNGYGRSPFDGMLEKSLDGQPSLIRVAINEAEGGDVLLMRMQKEPQHIAIHAGFIDGSTYIIHGSSQHGKVAHHRLDNLWRARVVRAYRVKV